MPTIYRKRYQKRPPTGELSEDQLLYLVDGWCLDGGYPDGLPFSDPDDATAAWRTHRAQVIEQARSEGKLIPAAWWMFEAPEGLRQLSGPDPLQPIELWKGEPRIWGSFEDAEAAKFETVDTYLDRLGIDRETLRRTK